MVDHHTGTFRLKDVGSGGALRISEPIFSVVTAEVFHVLYSAGPKALAKSAGFCQQIRRVMRSLQLALMLSLKLQQGF
ncbi:hypothetical protein ABIF66_001139 [Bradyrhizobium japonicum]